MQTSPTKLEKHNASSIQFMHLVYKALATF